MNIPVPVFVLSVALTIVLILIIIAMRGLFKNGRHVVSNVSAATVKVKSPIPSWIRQIFWTIIGLVIVGVTVWLIDDWLLRSTIHKFLSENENFASENEHVFVLFVTGLVIFGVIVYAIANKGMSSFIRFIIIAPPVLLFVWIFGFYFTYQEKASIKIDEWRANMKDGSNEIVASDNTSTTRARTRNSFPVYAENFTIPAMGKESVTRHGRCRTDSTGKYQITSNKNGSKIVFTSYENEDVFARIWFYDLGNHSSCSARYKFLESQGKIF